ncbi:MAG: dienelactone hydrolase family protein [Cyclobacteriaceae bacterium]
MEQKRLNGRKTFLIPMFLLYVMVSCTAQTVEKASFETIKFSNPALGFEASLTGILQVPGIPRKYPVIVFVHGSGQGTRNEYQNLFNRFLESGFAVFSYDKRGVNESTGTYNGVGPKNSPMMIPLLASDAFEAVEMLKKRPEIDSDKIIVMGGSQAGWIIPVVASMSKNVSSYVILYGTTVTVGREIFYSKLAETGSTPIEQAQLEMDKYTGIEGFDPVPYVAKLKQKGLWMFGGRDNSIPTPRSVQLLESINKTNGNLCEIKIYPEAGHGLINKNTGQLEDFIPYVLDWLSKN